MKHKIRVLIIEDSRLYQMYLQKIISADPVLEVAGIASDGQEALQMAKNLKPDVITLDLQLPDVKEYELLRTLVRIHAIPVIIVTSIPSACEKAICIGAGDFLEKIQAGEKQGGKRFELLLQMKIKALARQKPEIMLTERKKKLLKNMCFSSERMDRQKEQLIVIGASLGGTEATLEILSRLPECMPGILIVQHMPIGFTNAYAMRLDRNCSLAVREAKSGDLVLPGTALVAPGGKQLTVYPGERGYRIRCTEGEKVNGFCPSVDVTFRSAAAAAGRQAVGVILTGMGRDGAEGLKDMHDKGAYTFGQSRESCAVFGMPAAAEEAGAVDQMLSPAEIARALIEKAEQ